MGGTHYDGDSRQRRQSRRYITETFEQQWPPVLRYPWFQDSTAEYGQAQQWFVAVGMPRGALERWLRIAPHL